MKKFSRFLYCASSSKPSITLICDGVPYHRSQIVKDAATALNIKVEPLPGYSPDFMPVEHLWQWLRENVTYRTCYERQSTGFGISTTN